MKTVAEKKKKTNNQNIMAKWNKIFSKYSFGLVRVWCVYKSYFFFFFNSHSMWHTLSFLFGHYHYCSGMCNDSLFWDYMRPLLFVLPLFYSIFVVFISQIFWVLLWPLLWLQFWFNITAVVYLMYSTCQTYIVNWKVIRW